MRLSCPGRLPNGKKYVKMGSGKKDAYCFAKAEKGNCEIYSTVFMDSFIFFCGGIFERMDSSADSGIHLWIAPASSGTSDRGAPSGSGKGSLRVFD